MSDVLDLTRVADRAAIATLGPQDGAEFVAELVQRCGRSLLVDHRPTGSFDYLSGVRVDAPVDGMPVLDLCWYSSDRAAREKIAAPDRPSVVDFGWADDHRARVFLAGVIVLVLDVRGPDGEPDMRVVSPVSHAVPTIPPPGPNPYRRTSLLRDGAAAWVTESDAAGFTSVLHAWLDGGPACVLSTCAPSDSAPLFGLLDEAAEKLGLPVPRRAGIANRRR